MSQVAHEARTSPGFCSMKWMGVFILPPGWDASPSQGLPPALNWHESKSILPKNTTQCPSHGLNQDRSLWSLPLSNLYIRKKDSIPHVLLLSLYTLGQWVKRLENIRLTVDDMSYVLPSKLCLWAGHFTSSRAFLLLGVLKGIWITHYQVALTYVSKWVCVQPFKWKWVFLACYCLAVKCNLTELTIKSTCIPLVVSGIDPWACVGNPHAHGS